MWFNLGLHILGKTFRMGCFFNSVRSIVRKEKYFSYTFAYKQPQNEHVICSFVIQMLCILCEAVYIHIFICVFSAADGIFTMQQHLPVPMSVIVSTVSTLVHSMFFCPPHLLYPPQFLLIASTLSAWAVTAGRAVCLRGAIMHNSCDFYSLLTRVQTVCSLHFMHRKASERCMEITLM